MTDLWTIQAQTGFLMTPQPLTHLNDGDSSLAADAVRALEALAAHLPHAAKADLADLPCVDLPPLASLDARVVERLFLLYGYFANAWVHGVGDSTLPSVIAQPLTQLAAYLERPPILAYAGMVLGNWRLIMPDVGFTPQNVALLQTFTTRQDEAWFFRVHVAIEAQSGAILSALQRAGAAASHDDENAVLVALREVREGLVQITQTFHKMPELCDPDIYYQQVRPYLFGFTDVTFAGVESDVAMPLRGGSGAQSSVVPAILTALGIHHAESDLTRHLRTMRPYMPREHRAAIEAMGALGIRAYCAARPPLRDAYNYAVRQLMTFRRAHLYYAREYIFAKTTNPVGTGGTDFMTFLNKLIDETDAQLLR